MPAIARTLGLSVHGVDYHMRNILRKLDAHGIGYALSKAQHLGLIKFKPAAVRKKGTRKLAVKRGRDRQQRRAHFASLLKK
jgi:predicted transcriptional regulator